MRSDHRALPLVAAVLVQYTAYRTGKADCFDISQSSNKAVFVHWLKPRAHYSETPLLSRARRIKPQRRSNHMQQCQYPNLKVRALKPISSKHPKPSSLNTKLRTLNPQHDENRCRSLKPTPKDDEARSCSRPCASSSCLFRCNSSAWDARKHTSEFPFWL